MDLVELAGIDVSDWANFKQGKKWAAVKVVINWEQTQM